MIRVTRKLSNNDPFNNQVKSKINLTFRLYRNSPDLITTHRPVPAHSSQLRSSPYPEVYRLDPSPPIIIPNKCAQNLVSYTKLFLQPVLFMSMVITLSRQLSKLKKFYGFIYLFRDKDIVCRLFYLHMNTLTEILIKNK